jgi:hypothetical protein
LLYRENSWLIWATERSEGDYLARRTDGELNIDKGRRTVFGAWSILGSSIPLLSGRELLGDGFSLNVNGSKRKNGAGSDKRNSQFHDGQLTCGLSNRGEVSCFPVLKWECVRGVILRNSRSFNFVRRHGTLV